MDNIGNEKRMKDEHYKELVVTQLNGDVPPENDYVFISYRSNSWEIVLSKITYKLQKEYGLRIYFDKAFATDTKVWVEQLIKHMNTDACKAFLCFFDEGYCTSYATLIELMHAMNKSSNLSKSIVSINFPIDWEKITGKSYEKNTHLDEKEIEWNALTDEFKNFKRNYHDNYSLMDVEEYEPKKGRLFRECDCAKIMRILQPKNQHDFVDTKEFYEQHILPVLHNKTGGTVFEDPDKIAKIIGETTNEYENGTSDNEPVDTHPIVTEPKKDDTNTY